MSGETRIQVTKRRNEGNERCLYCHEDFEPDSIKVTCPQCDSPQHRACAMIHERCPTMGCTATWANLAGAGERISEDELSERAQALVSAHAKLSNNRAEKLRWIGRKFLVWGIVLCAFIFILVLNVLKNVNFWKMF
ncbi:MAG: RING finger protein [Planctomycetota bacterium]|nr:RING finger protein [Planctomycetota bacterium]